MLFQINEQKLLILIFFKFYIDLASKFRNTTYLFIYLIRQEQIVYHLTQWFFSRSLSKFICHLWTIDKIFFLYRNEYFFENKNY